MKKTTKLSKQILKAITVGLSASMMLQPVAAFAEEFPEGAEPKTTPLTPADPSLLTATEKEELSAVVEDENAAPETHAPAEQAVVDKQDDVDAEQGKIVAIDNSLEEKVPVVEADVPSAADGETTEAKNFDETIAAAGESVDAAFDANAALGDDAVTVTLGEGENKETITAETVAQDIEDANKAVSKVTDGIDYAEGALSASEAQLDAAEGQVSGAAEAWNTAVEKADAADTQAANAEKAVNDESDAKAKLDALDLKNKEYEALTEEEKLALTDEQKKEYTDAATAATKAVADANTAVETAAKNIEDLTADYNKAAENYSKAKTAYDTALDFYNITAAAYEKAVAALKDTTETVGEGEDAHEVTKTGDLSKAQAELQRLWEEAKALGIAAETAKEDFEASTEGALLKAQELQEKYQDRSNAQKALKEAEAALNNATEEDKEELTQKVEDAKAKVTELGGTITFGGEDGFDTLFQALIKNYYVGVLKNAGYTDINEENPGKFVKFTNGELNYYEIKCKDADGNDKTLKLNYKLANNNDVDTFGGLVVFEKTERVLLDGEVLEVDGQRVDDKFDKNGVYLKEGWLYTGVIAPTKDGYAKFDCLGAKLDGNVITDSLDIKNDEVKVTDVQENTINVTYTTGTVKDNSGNESTVVYKTETADVTTTTYTGKSLVSHDTRDGENALGSKAASKEDFTQAIGGLVNEKFEALKSGQSLVLTYAVDTWVGSVPVNREIKADENGALSLVAGDKTYAVEFVKSEDGKYSAVVSDQSGKALSDAEALSLLGYNATSQEYFDGYNVDSISYKIYDGVEVQSGTYQAFTGEYYVKGQYDQYTGNYINGSMDTPTDDRYVTGSYAEATDDILVSGDANVIENYQVTVSAPKVELFKSKINVTVEGIRRERGETEEKFNARVCAAAEAEVAKHKQKYNIDEKEYTDKEMPDNLWDKYGKSADYLQGGKIVTADVGVTDDFYDTYSWYYHYDTDKTYKKNVYDSSSAYADTVEHKNGNKYSVKVDVYVQKAKSLLVPLDYFDYFESVDDLVRAIQANNPSVKVLPTPVKVNNHTNDGYLTLMYVPVENTTVGISVNDVKTEDGTILYESDGKAFEDALKALVEKNGATIKANGGKLVSGYSYAKDKVTFADVEIDSKSTDKKADIYEAAEFKTSNGTTVNSKLIDKSTITVDDTKTKIVYDEANAKTISAAAGITVNKDADQNAINNAIRDKIKGDIKILSGKADGGVVYDSTKKITLGNNASYVVDEDADEATVKAKFIEYVKAQNKDLTDAEIEKAFTDGKASASIVEGESGKAYKRVTLAENKNTTVAVEKGQTAWDAYKAANLAGKDVKNVDVRVDTKKGHNGEVWETKRINTADAKLNVLNDAAHKYINTKNYWDNVTIVDAIKGELRKQDENFRELNNDLKYNVKKLDPESQATHDQVAKSYYVTDSWAGADVARLIVAGDIAKANNKAIDINVNVSRAAHTNYGYKLLATILKNVKEEKDVVVKKEVWSHIASRSVVRNDNDKITTGEIAFLATEEGYDYVAYGKKVEVKEGAGKDNTDALRKIIRAAAEKAGQYADVIQKAETAKKDVKAAKDEVTKLAAKIETLGGLTALNAELKSLNKDLTAANNKLSAAQTKLSTLQTNADTLADELSRKIKELTETQEKIQKEKEEAEKKAEEEANKPVSTDDEENVTPYRPVYNNDGDVDPTPSQGEQNTPVQEAAAPAETPAPAAEAPVADADANADAAAPAAQNPAPQAQNPAAQAADAGAGNDDTTGAPVDTAETTEIPDEDTAKADAPEETTEIGDEDSAKAAAPTQEMDDDETPLAALPEAAKLSWWWLLIVMVLGTSGAEMYRRHLVKKNASKGNDITTGSDK